jgi:hypothetical protein
VDHVEVEVVELQIFQGPQASRAHMLLPVIRVPQLRRHPQLVAGDHTLGECLLDASADILLVGIVGGTVQEAVAGLEGLDDHALDLLVGDLPQPQPHRWHAVP